MARFHLRVGHSFVVDQLQLQAERLGYLGINAADVRVRTHAEHQVLHAAVGTFAQLPVEHQFEVAETAFRRDVGAFARRHAVTRRQVLEARGRIGGRSWTVRGGDRIVQTGRPDQICSFSDGLYLNAGCGNNHYPTNVAP